MTQPKKQIKQPTKAKEPLSSALVPFAQLQKQYTLTLAERKALIRSEKTPTDNAIEMATQQAQMIGVPLQGINLIPTRDGFAVYINSDGIRWLLNTDPRGVKSIETHIIQMPDSTHDTVIVEGVVEFRDGSRFSNIGAVVVDPDNKLGKGKWNAADALMKAATKAKRRAGQDAVGTPLPVYEDRIEYLEEQGQTIKDVTPVAAQLAKLGNGNGEPTTLTQFLALLNNASIEVDTACKVLAVEQITDVKDFKTAWNKLKPKEG